MPRSPLNTPRPGSLRSTIEGHTRKGALSRHRRPGRSKRRGYLSIETRGPRGALARGCKESESAKLGKQRLILRPGAPAATGRDRPPEPPPKPPQAPPNSEAHRHPGSRQPRHHHAAFVHRRRKASYGAGGIEAVAALQMAEAIRQGGTVARS